MNQIPEHVIDQVEAAGKLVVTPKPLLQSKTMWWNVVTTVVNVAGSGIIPQPYGIVIQGVGNIILRQWFTEAPIK